MPLVHSIASMVSGKGLPPNIDYNDLVSDGSIGLMKAWDNFDTSRGVKFETYASYRIRGEILDGLKNYSPVPYRVQVMIRDLAKKGTKNFIKEKRVKEDLLEKKELTESEFKRAVSQIQKIVSASALMYLLSLEKVFEVRGEIDVAGEKGPEEEHEFSELQDRLNKSLENLPPVVRQVVELFYHQGLNQKTIATKLKLSRSKVNRILARAVESLKGELDGSAGTG